MKANIIYAAYHSETLKSRLRAIVAGILAASHQERKTVSDMAEALRAAGFAVSNLADVESACGEVGFETVTAKNYRGQWARFIQVAAEPAAE